MTPIPHRALLTASSMIAVLMQVLDSTIANVALPYMQGSLNATLDQIAWVLTSYVISSAIMTAPVGWLAQRFSRKSLFLICLVGFTVTSMMCGAAQSLDQIVVFRILQGAFGGALVPLSQATMLDTYTMEERAQAMAIFGIGVMVGPILGPTIGGWLTENYNWRWVFYVNLPFGVLSVTGIALFMPSSPARPELKFDWTGFAALAVGVGALQLMLDRGEGQDWFTSGEIIVEAVIAGLGLYLFGVHMLTAPKPFIPPALFGDANFTSGMSMMFATGVIMMASSALLAPYLQNLAGYPVQETGLLLAPRGFGTMAAMLISARMGPWLDARKVIAFGLLLLGYTLRDMAHWTPDISVSDMVTSMLIQGFAMGCIWNPTTVLSFVTLPPHLRGDATALQGLVRNVGAAAGISVMTFALTTNIQVSHASMAAGIDPFNRNLQGGGTVSRMLNPRTERGARMLDGMINRQAAVIAYSNDFLMMSYIVFPPLLLLPLMRRPRTAPRTVVAAPLAGRAPAE